MEHRERLCTLVIVVLAALILLAQGCGAAYSDEDVELYYSAGQISGVVLAPQGSALPAHLRVGLIWNTGKAGAQHPSFRAGASAAVTRDGDKDSPTFSVLVDLRHEQLPATGTLVVFVDLDEDGTLDLPEGSTCGDRVLGLSHNTVVSLADTLEVRTGTAPCLPDCKNGKALSPGSGLFGRPLFDGVTIAIDEDRLLGRCPASEPLSVYGYCYAARETLRQSIEAQCGANGPGCQQQGPAGVFSLPQLASLQQMKTYGCCGIALGETPWYCSPTVGCPDGYVCCKDTCRRTCAATDLRDIRWPYIPPGEFVMGSPEGELCRDDYEIEHAVKLTDGFVMGSTEVTQADFFRVMGYTPDYVEKPDASLPIGRLTWHEAAAYCNRLSLLNGYSPCYLCTGERDAVECLVSDAFAGQAFYKCPGYRLPTEAEWEYAYKAGTSTSFYNGQITDCSEDPLVDEIAWYAGNAKTDPYNPIMKPVGLKRPNAYGLYDMAGNEEEWVQDGYARYAEPGQVGDVQINPVFEFGLDYGDEMWVTKGGCISFGAGELRGATRNPRFGDLGAGLRCVRTTGP